MGRSLDELWEFLYDAGYEFDTVVELPGSDIRYYSFIKPPKVLLVPVIDGEVPGEDLRKIQEAVTNELDQET